MTSTFKIIIRFARYDGLIARLALITERRGFAIDTLSVVQATDDYFSMNLTFTGPSQKFEHVCQQIRKLVDVIDIAAITEGEKSWSNEESLASERLAVGSGQ